MKTRSKKRKQVHWNEDLEKSSSPNGQLSFFKKSFSKEKLFHRMRKKISESVECDDYQIFDFYLKQKNVTNHQLSEFYRDEWLHVMFYSSMNTYSESNLLRFFSKHLTMASTRYLLQVKDYEIMKHFVMLQKSAKKDRRYTEAKKIKRTEKLALLLQMDEEIIAKFMQNPDMQELISDDVRHEYQAALEQIRQKESNSSSPTTLQSQPS